MIQHKVPKNKLCACVCLLQATVLKPPLTEHIPCVMSEENNTKFALSFAMNDLIPVLLFVASMSIVSGFRQFSRWGVVARKSQRLMSTGHQASSTSPKLSESEELTQTAFKDRQAELKRLSYAEEVKTLLDQSIGFGVLSTNSAHLPGFPTGSVVGFQLDEQGLPFFSFSTMSSHTTDLLQNEKASLTVLAKDFKGAAEGRVSIAGVIKKVTNEETLALLRTQYRLRHKNAYWVDFG